MFDKKKIVFCGIVLLGALCGAIGFFYVIFHWSEFIKILRWIVSVLMPIIDGFIIAYLLIPIMDRIESRCIYPLVCRYSKAKDYNSARKQYGRLVRKGSIVLTLSIAGMCLYALFSMLVPHLVESIRAIINQLPGYIDNFNTWIGRILDDNPDMYNSFSYFYEYYKIEDYITQEFVPRINDALRGISTGVISSIASFAKSVGSLILGFIISIYLMDGKERFVAQFKKIVFAFMPRENANIFLTNLNFIHHTFIGFIGGKIIDSVIIGFICYFLTLIFKMPYPELISVVVGVTNIIPYFGPFLGAIPSALLILMVNPLQCLYFIILIIALQQFDGNFLGPKILGDSTGLSSFWVIFAITVFGSLFGVAGLFVGVPVFAVIYAFVESIVKTRLADKHLPQETIDYIEINSIDDEGMMNTGSEIKGSKKSWTLNKSKKNKQ